MSSKIYIKRTSVAGKVPTTSNIDTGELAVNLRDGRLYSSNGTNIFEVGANVHSLSIGSGPFSVGNNAYTFPNTRGSTDQVLSLDATGNLVFSTVSAGGGGNSFSSIAVSGGNTIISTASTQRLNLIAGNNISLSAHNANNTLVVSTTLSQSFSDINADSLTAPVINANNVVIGNGFITANAETTTSATQTVVDSFNATAFRTAKYVIQMTDTSVGNRYQSSEILLVHNGSAVFLTEFANIRTSVELGTIDADYNTNTVRLLVTPVFATTAIKVVRTTLDV